MPTLLVENSDSPQFLARLRQRLGVDEYARRIDPDLVSQYLDGLERTSISSVGLRAEASYRNLMGRNVAARLRASDTAQAGLGHVMMQTSGADGRSITVGGATAKGKVWSTQYTSLREHNEWVDDVTNRIWFARVGPSGRILPDVSRGNRLVEWPNSPIVSVDFAPGVHSGGWSFHTDDDDLNLEDVSLVQATEEWAAPDSDAPIEIQASLSGAEESPFWRGTLDLGGRVRTLTGTKVQVRRGYAVGGGVDEFLQATPPSIHFLDGRWVEGHVVYDSRARPSTESLSILRDEEWGEDRHHRGDSHNSSEAGQRNAVGSRGGRAHNSQLTEARATAMGDVQRWQRRSGRLRRPGGPREWPCCAGVLARESRSR